MKTLPIFALMLISVTKTKDGADWQRFVDQMGGKGHDMSFAVQVLR